MSQHFSTHDGSAIVADLVSVIVANRECLSEVDGAIGDGDHGINMARGFKGIGHGPYLKRAPRQTVQDQTTHAVHAISPGTARTLAKREPGSYT